MDATVAIVLVFGATSLGIFALLQAVFGAERTMTTRLKGVAEYVGQERKKEVPARPSEVVQTPGALERPALLAGRMTAGFWSPARREQAKRLMSSAGRVTANDVEVFLGSKVVYAVIGGLAATALGFALDWDLAFMSVMVAGAAIGGFLLPDSRVKELVKKRRDLIIRELPDVLDMLTISVTAGLGFEAAIAKMTKNGDGLVVSEFDRMLTEVAAGVSRKQAMRAMADRVDAPEMHSFVSAVVQAESFGTPIASVLRVQAADLRLKRRQRAEEQAQKAPVKMTIPLMLIILPATILLLLGPAMVSLVSAFG